MNGHEQISAERLRQIHVEGYTSAHDRGGHYELLNAAACYVARAQTVIDVGAQPWMTGGWADMPERWPWSAEAWKPTNDPRRDLVKAGALIAAAIDALSGVDRA